MYFDLSRELKPYLSAANQDVLKSAENRFDALILGGQLNNSHDLPNSQRFAPILGKTAAELATFMVYGREELYTSTYLYVVQRFLKQYSTEHISSLRSVFSDSNQSVEMAIFFEQAAIHNNLDDAINLLSPNDLKSLLSGLKIRMKNEYFSASVTFRELVENLKSNPEFLNSSLNALELWYSQEDNPEIKKIYEITMVQCNRVPDIKKYNYPVLDLINAIPMEGLSQTELVGKDGVNRQLMVFTDDQDGNNSFRHFINTYVDNPNYVIEQNESFVSIKSRNGNVPVEIYANLPDQSPNILFESLDPSNLQFDIAIHRGHSYNLHNSIEYFSPDNQLIFLGSCGGYNQVEKMLQISPLAQVISTKQTGSMYVNDPLLLYINEQIRLNGHIDWDETQAYLDKMNNEHAEDYLLPRVTLLLRCKDCIIA